MPLSPFVFIVPLCECGIREAGKGVNLPVRHFLKALHLCVRLLFLPVCGYTQICLFMGVVWGVLLAVEVNHPFSTCDGMPGDALNRCSRQHCMWNHMYAVVKLERA